MAAFLFTAPTHDSASAASSLDERLIVPQRAPEDVRKLELEAVDAALARRATPRASIEQEDIVEWLREGGKSLGRLLAATGIDPSRLILDAVDNDQNGVGGPFIELPGEGDATVDAIDTDALVARVLETVPLASPVRAEHRFTSGFGRRADPFHGRDAFHRGIDLAAAHRTPIYAPAAGDVVKVGRMGGFGNVIEIDHGNGVLTRYAHLHAYLVRRGDRITSGERIGLMGRTGRATGVHLHYEVMVDGQHVDPSPFLDVGRQLAADSR